jgi:hypothetical protein
MKYIFETVLPANHEHGAVLKTYLPTNIIESLNKSMKFTDKIITSYNLIDELDILILAYTLLTEAGCKVYKNQGILERHSYRSTSENTCVQTPLAIHIDNFGGTEWEVYTCIIYTQKDNTIHGGNIDLFDEEPSFIDWLLNCFGYKNEYSKKIEVQIEAGLVLLMSGDVYHKPQDTYGIGTRNCTVVQLRSKK